MLFSRPDAARTGVGKSTFKCKYKIIFGWIGPDATVSADQLVVVQLVGRREQNRSRCRET